MDINELLTDNGKDKLRIIQELVPGKQVTLAHIISGPDAVLYQKLGLNPDLDYARSAIGILTVSPAETAVIAADIAIKTANVDLGFVDRFSGTLIVTGMVSDTESAINAVVSYVRDTLGFAVCEVTRT
ncbi:MAG TPA: BMC domain-containing protein [Candidatus Avimonoglobus intestinipullorum]|uniref:BMC domain-containing protein n=1 Tax=Candidatus Avimonoglobus intestinipullorum TaxID=2840699 RepID=A0A9D1S5V3_9FIRM|nr:BMC domain-containing protein [Candidatus Avimonoglobus intestinipullorum]